MNRITCAYIFVLLLFATMLLVLTACGPAPSTEEETTSLPSISPPTNTILPPSAPPQLPTAPPVSWWHPTVGMTWQWQLSLPLTDFSVDAQVYDIDLFDNDASVVEALHVQGRKVICYISVGSWEDWRPDADQFPHEVLGKNYESWEGEKWLDIRQIDKLAPIMLARLDLCKEKGFDAVEPDNIEVYTNETGFPLTYEDQLNYAIWLANEAHARGLAIGLKNAPDQVNDLLPFFDFAIVEDCYAYGWCEQMLPFIQAGKPVFAAEYTDMEISFGAACRRASELNFSMIMKDRDLTALRVACP